MVLVALSRKEEFLWIGILVKVEVSHEVHVPIYSYLYK